MNRVIVRNEWRLWIDIKTKNAERERGGGQGEGGRRWRG